MKRIPISIHPLFWLFAAVIGFLSSGSIVGTIVWIVVILVSVLVHELGHALTGLAFKQRVHIQLAMFGGATYREGPKISLPKEFLLTLNGPLAGFALCAVAYGLLHVFVDPHPIVKYGLQIFVWVNLFWTVINLFPILPLDGGHLMRIILEGIFGARGASFALLASVVLGAGVAIAGFIMGYFIVGAIFMLLTFESFRAWKAFRHITDHDRDERLVDLFKEIQTEPDREEALKKCEQIRLSTGKGLLYVGATEAAARLLAEGGEQRKAYEYLSEIRGQLSPELKPLYHKLAYATGDYTTAIKLGKECYQIQPGYEVAYVNALAHTAINEVEPAIGWLKCALREGMPNLRDALSGPEFDPIRHNPDFESFVSNLS